MWKGYRDADFGWFETPEIWEGQWLENDESIAEPTSLKCGNWGSYLVIYAPYRNSIEIFRMNGCKRVYVKMLNENDKYYLRTISKEGPLSHLLNIPTKCYLIKENIKNNINEMKLLEIKLPIHSLDFIYMKKYSKSLAKDNYYMKILLKLLTNDKIDEKLVNEVKRIIEMNDLSQLRLQKEKEILLEEKDILILKIVFLIQSSILLKHILKKIEKGGLFNLSENLIRSITDTIYQRVNIEINRIMTDSSYEFKENENGIKKLLLSSYESVRWGLKCKLHLLDIYDNINSKYYNDILKKEEDIIRIEELFNEEYKDENGNRIIEKITKLKENSGSIMLSRSENWKLHVMKPVMFLCCLEASSSTSSSDVISEKDKEIEKKEKDDDKEEERIKYQFRSNNISESTSVLFSSYLFQLLLFYPDKIEEIYNIQNDLYLSNETMIILSYLWITSIPFQQIIKFPFSIYKKWLNLFEKHFNESNPTTTSLDSFIYDSIIAYVLKSNNLLNSLLFIDNIQKYCNNYDNDSVWNSLLYKINTTIGLSIINDHVFTISDISQNSIFDLINQLFYHFNHKYNVLEDTLMKLKDEIKESSDSKNDNNNNDNIVENINISDDISKVYSLFKILPYQYLNVDFLWFNFIISIFKNYDFQNNMNEFDEIYNLISYINNKQIKRTLLYILWNDYLFLIMRSIVETKEESSTYTEAEDLSSTENNNPYFSNFSDNDNILRYKMIIIQYSISVLTDIKSTIENKENDNEKDISINMSDMFPSNNFYNLHLENIQNCINNYSKLDIYSVVSIDIHLLYFRIIRLLLPSGVLFPNQWTELLDIFKCKDILLIPNSLLKSVFINDEVYGKDLNNIISSEDAINFLIKTLEVHSDIAYDLGYLLNIGENQIKVEICRMYYLHNDDIEGEKIYNEIADKNYINPALFYLIRQRLSFYIYFLRETKMRELEMKIEMRILRWIRKAIPKDNSKIPSQPLPFTLNDISKLIEIIKMSNNGGNECVNYDGISIDDLEKVCKSLL